MMKNGYMFYVDGILFPIAPSKMTTKYKNKNKTVTLINEGDYNILKESGLTEFSFEVLIPAVKYPFSRYIGGTYLPIQYYLTVLKKLKKSRKPFNLVIVREGTLGTIGYDTCLKVSLEDWSILEDAAGLGKDIKVNLKLKQFKGEKNFITKLVGGVGLTTALITKKRDSSSKKRNKTYRVKEGDTLYTIAKNELGDVRKLDLLKKLNKGILEIGKVIRLE